MKKLLKIGCGSLVGLFVLLLLIGTLVGNDDQDSSGNQSGSSTTNNDSKTEESIDKEEEKYIGIGEELTVGEVIFKVNSMGEVNEISAANGYMKYTPDAEGAVFLNVNVTVKNDSAEMIQTDSSFFKLIAENGAEYSPTTIIVADEKYFTYEGINPGLSLTGNVVFEVPAGLTGLDLKVQTGYWGTETGTINLN